MLKQGNFETREANEYCYVAPANPPAVVEVDKPSGLIVV